MLFSLCELPKNHYEPPNVLLIVGEVYSEDRVPNASTHHITHDLQTVSISNEYKGSCQLSW